MKRRILASNYRQPGEADRIVEAMQELQDAIEDASDVTFDELELSDLYNELLDCLKNSPI